MKRFKAVGGSLLITLSFVFFIAFISSVAMMTIENAMNHVSLISGIAQALYLLVVVAILKLRKTDVKSRCGVSVVPYKQYIIPAVVGFGFSMCSNILQTVLPIPEGLKGDMSGDMGNNVVAFVFAVFVVAPIVEEMVFRGLIMTKLRKEFSATVSILISAMLFAIIQVMAN